MRQPVERSKAYRLLNHGPTVLVTSAHAGRQNVMAAAWNMALDFEPDDPIRCWRSPNATTARLTGRDDRIR